MKKIVRGRMLEKGYELPDLAKEINRSTGHLSRALNYKVALRIDEAFKIGDILGFSSDEVREHLCSI